MKSKTVKLVVGLVAVGVLSGAYVGVKTYVADQEAKETEAEEGETVSLMEDTGSENITAVSYTADDEEVTLTKEDDTWVKDGEEDFPLSQSSVEDAVDGLASLSATQEIDDVEDLSEYDLDEPANQITITGDDEEDTILDIGMENSSGSYYIKKADDDTKVYVVDSSSIEPFMTTVYDMAESESFPTISSSTVKAVSVDKENGYTIEKDTDTLAWSVSDGEETDSADSTKVSDLTSAVSSLTYDKFVDYNCTDDSEYGFDDPYAVITVKYTEEEEVTADEDTDEAEESEDTDEADDSEDDEDSDEEETETVTVEKSVKIYVGDETGDDRYVKLDGSNQVYTIASDSLSEITDKTSEDFYSLSVSYISASLIDSLDITDSNGETHTIEVTRVVTEEETDSDDEDSDGSTTTTTTTSTYALDGEELDSTTFSTFYNKLINMAAQERLTEDYEPEEDPEYTFVYNESDGTKIEISYYTYDSSFYAAVVGDKVYLVNKMNLRDLEEAYDTLLNSQEDDSSDSSEETTDESTDDAADDTAEETDE